MKRIVAAFLLSMSCCRIGDMTCCRGTANHDTELTDESLYAYLVSIRVWYPDIVLMQARIESGNYTSRISRECRNIFGMKIARRRVHTQIGESGGYGVYASWQHSAIDRMLWDYHVFGTKPSREEYLRRLRIYSETEDYIKRIL